VIMIFSFVPEGPTLLRILITSSNQYLYTEVYMCSLNDFDILVVTETHLDNQINDSDITLDSFPNIIHRKDRSNRGGWLLIYWKNDISISRKSEYRP
jgi:hypothetical protein